MQKVIEVKNLTKKFKELTAVNNLDLNVYSGDIFGFLGPNGAGKSTTIRMLTTLINPSSGTIKIFDKPLKQKRNEILRKVGAIVEKPDFYGYLSAYKNLEILGQISGCDTSNKRIMEILETVGLEKRAKSKVKTFSHGMKQRLGLGQALLHDPELIILDEPTTGLDPQGMKEIRELIIYLAKEKQKTIFLSSHILAEVELVANRMIIINKGATVVEGMVQDLLNASQLKVSFEIDEIEKAKILLAETQWKKKIESFGDYQILFLLEKEEISPLNKFLVEQGIGVHSIVPKRSLEEYFLHLTEKGA
ncbi:MAG: bacitracin ABC transporter ATP-binding protein [Ignavibacteria bacterium CG_4_8_14_3_um_filter_37_9]|nr:ABC transporter ATP-binding protein [Ignavibacteria bacterium]OIO18192.1 MAG: bacitracin ABC transporter ATP-binding protein [Ignavibacteria bacterium CG1_02_37_35]PIP77839.1 MAG: bacitracin ABC transporter ATP-binding protein [Ignavibacteria bacterium CG22_combo_CG10-13_8_21_14_all_37_15]PIW99449.1 MAG: bacitracin ABC transporter ATP-binding protein [Ignavibacteria bacterium CG_4_8_14_3_um_filter_37_9]